MGWDQLKNKQNGKEKETKYSRLKLTSDPVLEKLQRYATGTM